MRALTAMRLGCRQLPPADYLVRAAEAGKRAEQWYTTQYVRQLGHSVHGSQASVTLPAGDNLAVSGHIDGIEVCRHIRVSRLLEIKSMSERRFMLWVLNGFDSFPKYKAQITVYGYMIRLPITYVVINRDSWDCSKRAYTEVRLSYLPANPYPIKPILDKLQAVEEYARRGVLPSCDGYVDYCNMGEICQRRG